MIAIVQAVLLLIAIVQSFFFLLLPFIVIESAKRNKVVKSIGPVVICYGLGMLAGNIPGMPLDRGLSEEFQGFTVALAIPMLLISTDVLGWLRSAGKSVLSFCLSIVAVTISACTISYFMLGEMQEVWKYCGMMIGVYTGGTPNMSAIGLALDVPDETFVLINATDIVFSATYLFFLISVGKKVLSLFLPQYQFLKGNVEVKDEQPSSTLSLKTKAVSVLILIVIAAAALGASAGLSMLIAGEITAPITLLGVSLAGVGLSFDRKIRSLPFSYDFGEYLLFVFCLAIGTTSSIVELINSGSIVFVYVGLVISMAISLHFLLAAIFRIDVDTVMVTSTAGILGPAFIGVVASALKNREIVVAGIATGLVGYAVANFLGMGVAYGFRYWFY